MALPLTRYTVHSSSSAGNNLNRIVDSSLKHEEMAPCDLSARASTIPSRLNRMT